MVPFLETGDKDMHTSETAAIPERLRRRLKISCLMIAAVTIITAGCSTMAPRVVRQGDNAVVDYTCRLKTGEVVLTTSEETARNTASHAAIFVPFKKYGPETLTAGVPYTYPLFGRLKICEREAAALIAGALPGMEVGRGYTILLRAETPPGLTDEDRYVKLQLVQHMSRIEKTSLENVRNMLGHDPVPGEKAFTYEGTTGIVKSVDGANVIIRLEVQDGHVMEHPFGRMTIRDTPGEAYDVVTDAKVGHLVRSMALVGRITEVSDKTFTLDYGNPFGGEDLSCDVKVESVLPGAGQEKPKTGEVKQP